MNQSVCDVLGQVLKQNGPDVIYDPGRLAAILRDKLAGNRRDVNLLVTGLQAGVPREIVGSSTAVPWEVLEARLVRKLLDDAPLADDAARECVRVWARALGRATETTAPLSDRTVPYPDPKRAKPATRRGSRLVMGLLVGAVLVLAVGALVAMNLSGWRDRNGTPDSRQPEPHNEPVALTDDDATKTEYVEYRRRVMIGQGSVVFIQQAAPARFAAWRTQAEAGKPIAQLFVGRCYQEGVVATRDQAVAVEWLQKSAAQGNDFAIHTLGLAYEQGKGVPADRSKALQQYTLAANAGNTAAMRALGFLFEPGDGKKADLALALSWYQKAADKGDPVAMKLVGTCYRGGRGVTKDTAAAERWFRRAAEAGECTLVGKFFGNRMAPHYVAYLAPAATAAARSSALSALRDLKGEYERLELANLPALFSSDLGTATDGVADLGAGDPLRQFHDDVLRHYAKLFARASRSERLMGVADFARTTEPLAKQWFVERRDEQLVTHWEESFKDVPMNELDSGAEIDTLIRQLSWSSSALMRVGKRKEAGEAIQSALARCDSSLKDNPWDWYLKDAYSGLCFAAAEVYVEVGEPAQAQPLLRRGWGVRLRQFGKEALLDQYAELPLKGKAPTNATVADREFFESLAPGADKSKSKMTRFTIPCDFAGKKYPFHVYVLSGPRGYAELQDQFRWLKEKRGGEVPADVRESFQKLNKLAVENKVDFRELCVYSLGNKDATKGK